MHDLRKYGQKLNGLPNWHKFIIVLSLILFFIILIVAGIFCIDICKFHQFFDEKYRNQIKPEGELAINKIVFEVSNISDKQEKLDKIAKWEMTGFESYHWEEGSECYSSVSIFKPIYDFLSSTIGQLGVPCCPFSVTNTGKIRVTSMVPSSVNPYFDNPYWIAYYKTGACGELATLFNYTANKSGFITQVVTTGSHSWVEVKNDDGEWWYFDPLCYKVISKENIQNQTKWFNKTQYFRENCYDESLDIKIKDSSESVAYRYTRSRQMKNSQVFLDLTLHTPEIFRTSFSGTSIVYNNTINPLNLRDEGHEQSRQSNGSLSISPGRCSFAEE